MAPKFSYNLPSDLTLMVLLELDSPKDVYSFIRTSSSIYDVFQHHKAAVLLNALENAVPELAKENFLAAHQAYTLCSLPTLREYDALPKTRRVEYQLRYVSPEYQNLKLEKISAHLNSTPSLEFGQYRYDMDAITSLCKLWFVLDYFVGDFAKKAFLALTKYPNDRVGDRAQALNATDAFFSNSTPYDPNTHPLSVAEYQRLFRAFCSFEEYRRLFGGLDHVSRGKERIIHEVQFDFGLRRYRWEHYELLSVWRYAYVKLRDIVEEEENRIVSVLRESVMKEGNDLSLFDHISRSERHELEILDTTVDRGLNIEFMVELGLPFLKHLLTSSSAQRRSSLNQFRVYLLGLSLAAAVAQDFQWAFKETTGAAIRNAPIKMNPACTLFPYSSGYDLHLHNALNDSGVIFWDQVRLDAIKPRLSQADLFAPSTELVGVSGLNLTQKVPGKVRKGVVNELLSPYAQLEVDDLYRFLDDLEYKSPTKPLVFPVHR